MNNKNEAYKTALVAVLIEAEKQGLETQHLFEKASTGILDGRYAPAGTSAKTDSIQVLREAVEAAEKYKAASSG